MKNTIPEVLKDESLYSIMAMGVIVSDANENIEWVNSFFCDLIDAVPESLIGAPVSSILNLSKLQPVNYVQRYEVKTDAGYDVWLQCSKTSIKDKNDLLHHVRLVTDISEFQSRQNSRTAVSSNVDESRMDETTGVLNRKAILQELQNQVSRSRRYGNSVSAILLKCEFTQKVISDKKNNILLNIANAIKANLRWVDQIGVLSDDRFLLILPESDQKAAQQAWQKINSELLEVTMVDGQQYLNCELAISQWQIGDDKERMLAKLEHGLIQVKAA